MNSIYNFQKCLNFKTKRIEIHPYIVVQVTEGGDTNVAM